MCTRALARLYEWDCWVAPPHIWIDSLFAMSAMACSLTEGREREIRMASFFFHIWFDVCLRCRVVLRCMLLAVVNARWTTSNQKLFVLQPNVVVLEPQWIKSNERAKRFLISPVYSLRGIHAYDELQIVVTEVGQVKQMVTAHAVQFQVVECSFCPNQAVETCFGIHPFFHSYGTDSKVSEEKVVNALSRTLIFTQCKG